MSGMGLAVLVIALWYSLAGVFIVLAGRRLGLPRWQRMRCDMLVTVTLLWLLSPLMAVVLLPQRTLEMAGAGLLWLLSPHRQG